LRRCVFILLALTVPEFLKSLVVLVVAASLLEVVVFSATLFPLALDHRSNSGCSSWLAFRSQLLLDLLAEEKEPAERIARPLSILQDGVDPIPKIH